MKSKVLDRPMFKNMEEVDVDNVGILQGFKDMLGDDWEDDEEDEYEEVEVDEVSSRRPDSPEILMNNLRGDMRSVDARVEELADMVGYGAAVETPPEVLALLQPVLGAQEAMAAMPPMPPQMPPGAPAVAPQPPMPPGGIAALGGTMPPEMEAAVPPMPMEAPPMEAPIQMRNGGIVQRFKDGSDEEGVTAQNISYPPELVERARQEITNYLAQKPIATPELSTLVEQRVPLYQQVLGTGDRSATQAQILFDIAQAGLNLAAGTNAAGQPLRGRQSAASRLASAFQALPSQIGARVSEMEKEQRQVRLAALQGAEKDIANIREQNSKLVESQRKMFSDVIKSSGTSPFGKGDWQWSVVNTPGLLANWAAGKTSDEQNNLIQSAITVLTTDRTETRTDPVTQRPYTVTIPAKVPKFVTDAIAARNTLMGTQGPVTTAPPAIPPAEAGKPATGGAARPTDQVAAPAAPKGGPDATTATAAPAPTTYSAGDPTLFNMAGKGTGIVNVPLAFLSRVPLVGEFISAEDQVQATTFIKNAVNQINRSVATSPRFAEGERKQIQAELGLFPSVIDREEAYINRLIGLDTLLLELRQKAYKQGYENRDLKPADIAYGREKVQEIDSIRGLMGLPPRVTSKADFDSLPAGSPYILNGSLRVKR